MATENDSTNELKDVAEAAAQPACPPDAGPTPPEDVSDLNPEALESLKAEAAKAKEHWERLLRATADFDNYKKRITRERQEASKYAFVPLLEKLIPVLDHFDIALAAARNSDHASGKAFEEGMAMIHQQLRSTLTESGLEEIDAQGQPFDPNFHEAVSQQPSTEVAEGHVMQQLRKGYCFRDRLLRPASVVVAKAPEGESEAEPNANPAAAPAPPES